MVGSTVEDSQRYHDQKIMNDLLCLERGFKAHDWLSLNRQNLISGYTTTRIEGRTDLEPHGTASLREIMATFESQLMLKHSSSRLVCFIRICLCYDSDPLHNLSSIMVPTGRSRWNGGR